MPPNSTKLPFCLLLGQQEAGRGRAVELGVPVSPSPPAGAVHLRGLLLSPVLHVLFPKRVLGSPR